MTDGKMTGCGIVIQRGFPERCRSRAATLYDEAFGQKLSLAIRSPASRLAVLDGCLMPEYCICALAGDRLVGIAGYHDREGALTGGMGLGGLIGHLGLLGGVRAAVVLSLYERKPAQGELLMDGIAVDSDFRGQSIGSRLLDALVELAGERRYERIRLDVIDDNPRARKLYERKGFQPVRTESFPWLRPLLGFGGSTTMILAVKPETRATCDRSLSGP